ncbi:hypothetical protein DIPPA_21923 [Diplonema papillatum]|nr:hypothetical protein DIPPA_21923 [Diplonema papillatum]
MTDRASPIPPPGRRTGARKTTSRRSGDVQYDFKVMVTSGTVQPNPATGYPPPGYKYQVRWKRGEKLSGKTGHLSADSDGCITFNYEAAFASTIQRKDAGKLHKKVMNFMLAEFRPRDGGKHDKKTWEGSFNLAAAVGAGVLGSAVPVSQHTVPCGKEPGIVLHLTVSATPRAGNDSDLMTDMPQTDAGGLSNDGADVVTELSLDDADDDDELDALPPPRSLNVTLSNTAAAAAGPGVPMKEHLKVAEENRLLKDDLQKAQKTMSTTAKMMAKLRDDLEKKNAMLQALEATERESRTAVDSLSTLNDAASERQALFKDELLLLLHGVAWHVGPDLSQASTLLKALVHWGAFREDENPAGKPNTFLINSVAVFDCQLLSIRKCDVHQAAKWAGILWALLTELVALPEGAAMAQPLNTAIDTFSRGDFPPHVFSTLQAEPIRPFGTRSKPPELMLSPDEHCRVLRSSHSGASPANGKPPAPLHEGVFASYVAHCVSFVHKAVTLLVEGPLVQIDCIIPSLLDCRPNSDDQVLRIVQDVHKALASAQVEHSLVLCVCSQLFSHVDAVLFNALLREPKHCTDACVLHFKEMCGRYERWMKDAKIYGKPPTKLEKGESGCRLSLLRLRQACDLILLRGGTVGDPALWSAHNPEHLHVLLKNVKVSSEVHDDVYQQAVALGKGNEAKPVPTGRTAVSLPKVASDLKTVAKDWQREPLPPCVSHLTLSLAPRKRLSSAGHRTTDDPQLLI